MEIASLHRRPRRPSLDRHWILVAALVLGVALTTLVARKESGSSPPPAAPAVTSATAWHVSAAAPPGGDGTAARPYAGIDDALVQAQPGDQVVIAPGRYLPFVTRRAGAPDAPIHITGNNAHIVGTGDGRVVDVPHSYVTLEGLDISRGDVLVRVAGARGVRLLDSVLHDANSECVRLRDGTSNAEILRNRIERCGLTDFDLEEDRKNGEGVYIGVAPEQLGDDPGASAVAEANLVSDNDITVPGECVDIKEGATRTLVRANRCRGGEDPEGAGFSSRGDQTTFRDNSATGQAGAGIRLGGDGPGQGIGNTVVGNRLVRNDGYGLKVERVPQGEICGNEVSDNDDGVTNGDVDPRRPCPSGAQGVSDR